MPEKFFVTSAVTFVTQKVTFFCRAIDFYGDVGVCLRLARGLTEMGCQVTLVTDRPDLALAMNATQCSQTSPRHPQYSLRIVSWNEVPEPSAHELVIEAFQVSPPRRYLQACGPGVRRICLDYLATEDWAEGLQGLPAPDTAFPAHQRIWLAPSFSSQSSGPPRNAGLQTSPGLPRGRWADASAQDRADMRSRLLASYSVSNVGSNATRPTDSFLVLTFGYDDAPWDALAQVMGCEGAPKDGLLQAGLPEGFDRVCFVRPEGLAFSHDEFDVVLQSCDLNFVRGEDSFVRAHYAAAGRWQVPFVWQPYRQAAGAHLDKLRAWQQRLIPAEEVQGASGLQDFSSPQASVASVDLLAGVWQSWLGLEAFFNLVADASVQPVAPTSSDPPGPLAPPARFARSASQKYAESLVHLSRSWQPLQQNWDLFRTTFSGACQRLIPEPSLETTLLQIFSSRSDL